MPICLNAAFIEPANPNPSGKLCSRAASRTEMVRACGRRNGCGCSCPCRDGPSASAKVVRIKFPPLVGNAVDLVRRDDTASEYLPRRAASDRLSSSRRASSRSRRSSRRSRGLRDTRRLDACARRSASRGADRITWSRGPSTDASNPGQVPAWRAHSPMAFPTIAAGRVVFLGAGRSVPFRSLPHCAAGHRLPASRLRPDRSPPVVSVAPAIRRGGEIVRRSAREVARRIPLIAAWNVVARGSGGGMPVSAPSRF